MTEKSEVVVGERGVVDTKKTAGKEITPVQALSIKYNSANDLVADLSMYERECEIELAEIRAEIAEKTYALKKRQKELRAAIKTAQDKKLMVLGERAVYYKHLEEYGVKPKKEDLTKVLNQQNDSKK